jgi:hypothetical protein
MGTACADGHRMSSILQQTYPGNSSAILTRDDNCFVLDRARRETEERLRPRARDVMVMMNRQGKRKYRDANAGRCNNLTSHPRDFLLRQQPVPVKSKIPRYSGFHSMRQGRRAPFIVFRCFVFRWRPILDHDIRNSQRLSLFFHSIVLRPLVPLLQLLLLTTKNIPTSKHVEFRYRQ